MMTISGDVCVTVNVDENRLNAIKELVNGLSDDALKEARTIVRNERWHREAIKKCHSVLTELLTTVESEGLKLIDGNGNEVMGLHIE